MNVSEIARMKSTQIAVASVLSAAAGAVAGYMYALKLLEKKFAELALEEIEDARLYYARRNKDGEFADPVALASGYADEVVEEISEKLVESKTFAEQLGYIPGEPPAKQDEKQQIEVKESLSKNIFDSSQPVEDEDDEFDLEAEKQKRDPKRPYILSHDEFFNAEYDWNQNSLTYFQGDDVLVDEQDSPINDVRNTIGEENLRFGHGSKDANIVYIRNHKLELDFEVTRSFGKYTEEVLGAIEHEEKRGPRKFRVYD